MLRKMSESNLLEYLTIFMSVVLLHNFYLHVTTPAHIIIQKNPKFQLLGPYHNSSAEPKSVLKYNRLVDLDFKFVIKEECKEEAFLLVVIVSSNPWNFELRNTIRTTWGKSNNAMKVVFLLGLSEDITVAKDIILESQVYGDVIQGNFLDSYRNLTYKHVMGLKWAAQHCARARFVLKTDDDVFVNYRELVRFLTRELSPWGAQRLILCLVSWNEPVVRDKNNKWYVTKEEFEPNTYPPYCSGYFVIYSQDVVVKLVLTSETMKYFYVDDVFVTGMLPEVAAIPRTSLKYMVLGRQRFLDLWESRSTNVDPFLVGPINLEPIHLRILWDIVSNKTLITTVCIWIEEPPLGSKRNLYRHLVVVLLIL